MNANRTKLMAVVALVLGCGAPVFAEQSRPSMGPVLNESGIVRRLPAENLYLSPPPALLGGLPPKVYC